MALGDSSWHARLVGHGDRRISERSEEICQARLVGYDNRKIRERSHEDGESKRQSRSPKAFRSVQSSSPQHRDRKGRLLATQGRSLPPRDRRSRAREPRRKRLWLSANISGAISAAVARLIKILKDIKETEKLEKEKIKSRPELIGKLLLVGLGRVPRNPRCKFNVWRCGDEQCGNHVTLMCMACLCKREAIWCLAFPCTFQGKALTWFCNLPDESITSWQEFKKPFMTEFGWLDLFEDLEDESGLCSINT